MTLEDCLNAVERLDVLPYFVTKGGTARMDIAKFLFRMIGQADELRGATEELEFVERNGYRSVYARKVGGETFTPAQRLDWLITAILEDVGRWPDNGMADVRAVYCRYFPPADGREQGENEVSDLARPPSPPAAEQVYIPAPEDEPIGEEITAQIARVAERKRLR